jgi:UDP-N-acetylmuramoyl-L-alanyl-D-glutamate--2,6-diaminopimelate ligase
MFSSIKKQIKKITPEGSIIFYHKCNSHLAALWYGNPSERMTIIGITGTKGKTSTSEFTWSVLSHGGHFKTGLIGTAHTYIGETEIKNDMHMTMPSPWYTQKILKRMVKEGCTHAVLEVSSEGLKQYRHLGINYDIGIFTNLSPEHLASHKNSYEEYRKTKSRLFEAISKSPVKKIGIKKTGIFNKDSEDVVHLSNFPIDQKIFYSYKELEESGNVDTGRSTFVFEGEVIHVALPGVFNIQNALVAATVGSVCGVSTKDIKNGIEHLTYIPGRMERVDLGQKFQVYIDYAHEKLSMRNLLETLGTFKQSGGKIILLFGAEGGGRDKTKRKEMGLLAKDMADVIILANVDPYDDDPKEIIDDIAQYVISEKNIINKNVFLIEDRKEAIKKAFQVAENNDIVCICGKGAEKTMVIGGKTIPWDEQKIVRELLTDYIKIS